MTLGDNGKHVALLLLNDDDESNQVIKLNHFGEGPGMNFICNSAKSELILRIICNHFAVNNAMGLCSIESMAHASGNDKEESKEESKENKEESQSDNNLIGLNWCANN